MRWTVVLSGEDPGGGGPRWWLPLVLALLVVVNVTLAVVLALRGG